MIADAGFLFLVALWGTIGWVAFLVTAIRWRRQPARPPRILADTIPAGDPRRGTGCVMWVAWCAWCGVWLSDGDRAHALTDWNGEWARYDAERAPRRIGAQQIDDRWYCAACAQSVRAILAAAP